MKSLRVPGIYVSRIPSEGSTSGACIVLRVVVILILFIACILVFFFFFFLHCLSFDQPVEHGKK